MNNFFDHLVDGFMIFLGPSTDFPFNFRVDAPDCDLRHDSPPASFCLILCCSMMYVNCCRELDFLSETKMNPGVRAESKCGGKFAELFFRLFL
jgi:hypothetical protein